MKNWKVYGKEAVEGGWEGTQEAPEIQEIQEVRAGRNQWKDRWHRAIYEIIRNQFRIQLYLTLSVGGALFYPLILCLRWAQVDAPCNGVTGWALGWEWGWHLHPRGRRLRQTLLGQLHSCGSVQSCVQERTQAVVQEHGLMGETCFSMERFPCSRQGRWTAAK